MGQTVQYSGRHSDLAHAGCLGFAAVHAEGVAGAHPGAVDLGDLDEGLEPQELTEAKRSG